MVVVAASTIAGSLSVVAIGSNPAGATVPSFPSGNPANTYYANKTSDDLNDMTVPATASAYQTLCSTPTNTQCTPRDTISLANEKIGRASCRERVLYTV